MCVANKKLNASAVRFFRDAFAAEPKRAEELDQYRYNAACAAALAGCGQGEDVAKLDDAERSRLRLQALEWLTAELLAWQKLSENPADRPRAREKLQHWQKDKDFASVRDVETLAKLPEAERANWQKIWADVADLLKRTDEPKAAEKPDQKP
jgi:hypothetical protein